MQQLFLTQMEVSARGSINSELIPKRYNLSVPELKNLSSRDLLKKLKYTNL